jgi:hypothetical protein
MGGVMLSDQFINWPTLDILAKDKKIEIKQLVKNKLITFNDPLEEHIELIDKHIYAISRSDENKTDLSHQLFGIQHAVRTAILIPVLANLFRRYQDKEAKALTDDDIKLIQIAMQFQDAIKSKESEQQSQFESGALLYHYLTQTLNIGHEKADMLAKAVANRGLSSSNNIYQKLIDDVSRLDSIRITTHFDANQLQFYQCIAKENQHAFQEMSQLITEVRSLIETQKNSYEKKEGYDVKTIKADILKEEKFTDNPLENVRPNEYYEILPKFLNLIPDPEKEILINDIKSESIEDDKLQLCKRNGKLYFRGVGDPSAVRYKVSSTQEGPIPDETFAHVEIRKMLRILGVPTRTTKPNRFTKEDNPWRSISLIGSGAGVYCDVGFLLADPKPESIRQINSQDIGTGNFKKKFFDANLKEAIKQKQLKDLWRRIQMGGQSQKFGKLTTMHNEILCNIKSKTFDAVMYTHDPNLYNKKTLLLLIHSIVILLY